ncbi:MAG TPA: MBL fold metallo-hydrolase [Ktedonobacterales bacterium]|jgi:glyoxylase-like metal-dependent hydrolase (beta-lactamase superfamily II)
MPNWAYTKGLHDLGNSVYAYLQPDGTWGWSNAGLISDSGTSLLIDTLFDLHLTEEMLATMRKAVPAAAQVDLVVNTHANGDHCYGNQLVANAKIIASQRTADEMQHGTQPEVMALLMKQAPMMGTAGAYFLHAFSRFNFEGISVTLPKETFEGELTLSVGSKPVHLLEVGPAHTQGDTMVHLPDEKVIFTGDILFIGGHPIVWAGPVSNWLRACDRILALDVDVIVPGHGPITDKHGVTEIKGYLEYVYGEARKRYDAGMSAAEAARDIPMDRYATWTDGERIAVNIATCYREFSGEQEAPNALALFAMMGALLEERKA